ncbi:uncharacterized protein V1513DRAFT_443478 [Lipomyces chichibuensis]|uniref:uncharacterized protein n=1 Tax=Lipomyces chichibuensis TaxID=1546026 RepID=UPI003343682C
MRQTLRLFFFVLFATIFGVAAGANKGELHDENYMKKLLKSSSLRPGVIRLTDNNFDSVVSAPRDYGLVVLLTAEAPQMGCHLCREFGPNYNLVAQSWHHEHPKGGDGLYFGVLDFRDGQKTFQKLQLKTAPNLWVYAPTVGADAGPVQPFNYEIVGVPDVPGSVIRFIESHISGVHITIHRPRDYNKVAMTILSTVAGVGSIKYIYPFLRPIIESRAIWAGLSLVLILMFTSGHMFNNIRHTPYVAGNREGGVQYVAPGFSSQYGFETQAIAVLYAFLAFGAISLATKTPRMPNRTKQTMAIGTWCTLILCLFSLLLFIFRLKNRGYPFSLPPMSK